MIKTPVDGQNLTGNDRYEGYCVDLAERLAKILNISYELRLVKDNKFGSKGKSNKNCFSFYLSQKFIFLII